MYGLTEDDLDIQKRARIFADELIPHEEAAALAGGELPADLVAAHAARARELGLCATNMPRELGGGGCTTLQQVLVQEQVGRVTNALAWAASTPPSWLPAAATADQIGRYVRPAIRGEREECYAITEENAGSDVAAIEATARRDGDGYLLNGVKWHVTSFNTADYAFFQAKLDGAPHDGEHAMFFVDLPSPGVNVVRTPAYSHTISHHHPIVAFSDVRVPAANLVGAEGDGMTFAYEWFRFERLMVAARCLGRGADVKVAHAQCSMAKLYCSEMAGRVADRAVQVFGGRGYMRENVAERFYRELRVERIWEGTSEVQRAIIASQMVTRGPAVLA